MTKVLPAIERIQEELTTLSQEKTLAQAQKVILSVIRLLDNSLSPDNNNLFQLFNVDNQKISANATWFYEDSVIIDRRAIYKVHAENNLNIDFKLYGISKPSKRTISWVQALIPNFEDEPFNSKYNIGIDFIVPKSFDRVIIVLSNNYVIRTLELKETLTATYQEILAKWAGITDFSNKKEVHSILWESFDLQPLNKKFYAGISERFITLRQHLTAEGIFDNKHASLFANRLIGRIIFCWFLDKKGVINPAQKYFNSELFDSDTEYYRKNLENLFFGVLNTPIDDREYKDDVTPFLNGGLFEARDTDLYKDQKLTFPKNYFDDLFTFLSGYNFTTDESTSQFQQVAIDPEMLGRIFENLLAEMTEETGEQARKAKGAFYTPREIVDYMCRESLREYLKTKIPEDEFRDQRLVQLIDAPDKDFQDQDHNWRRDWKPYKDTIIKALDDLKVLDPACGSGAFPIGMLQLLVRVYERLEPRFDTYKAKLQIVEKNIYGVDIEPMAVEIARLRAWLSIIVDEESDSKKIKPLPNLEFKFICANSLIDLDHNGSTPFGDNPIELANNLQAIRDDYFNTTSVNKKNKLREKYKKLVSADIGLWGQSNKSKQLKTYRPFDNEWSASFFDPSFMFGIPSFEIVIGNPPYLRIQGLQRTQAEMVPLYRKNYESAQGSFDLYALFIERGYKLLSNNGQLVYIVPHKFFQATFGKKLRNIITSKKALSQIVKFGAEQVFENPTTYTCLLFLSTEPKDEFKYTEVTSMNNLTETMGAISNQREVANIIKSKLPAPISDEWSFQAGNTRDVFKALNNQPQKLGDVVEKIFQGIATSADKIYVLRTVEEKQTTVRLFSKSLEKEVEIEKGLLRPFLMGKDIHRYENLSPKNWVIFPYTISGNKVSLMSSEYIENTYPLGWAYIAANKEALEEREKGRFKKEWWCFSRPQNMTMYDKTKIITPDIAHGCQMSFDNNGFCHTTTLYSFVFKNNLSEDTKYWLGILNSNLFWFFLTNTGSVLRGGFFRFKTNYLTPFPIKRIDFENEAEKEAHDQIVKLVDTILNKKKSDSQANTLEEEATIDRLVYELYALSADEIKLIEASRAS